MNEARGVEPDRPELFRRIGFDQELEGEALRRLSALDIEGCRAAFGRLADRLVFRAGDPGKVAVVLLLDVLQRVNRRVHRAASDPEAFHGYRVSLMIQFSGFQDPEDARRAFMPALNRVLGKLQMDSPVRHPLVERAQAYIEDHYNRRLSLSIVARHLHVSPGYLSRIFHREARCRMTEFIHRVRLEHARLLLARGGRSISEIAYLVGYQNYRDFYRNFVKYEKASPREIRRKLAADERSGAASAPKGDSA